MRSIIFFSLIALFVVTLIYWKVREKAAFAALAQAGATIVLVAVTWFYVGEVRRAGSGPLIGVTDVKFTRLLSGGVDTYDDIQEGRIDFRIENTGTRPAKNCQIRTTGKIGNTTLPHNEDDKPRKGVVIFPGTKIVNKAIVGKDALDRLVKGHERLIFTVEISYTDWEEQQRYSYSQVFRVVVVQNEPLELTVGLVEPE